LPTFSGAYTALAAAGQKNRGSAYAANITEARLGGQVVARARRTTTQTSTGTESGVLRVGPFQVYQNVAYQIYTSSLNLSPSVGGLTAEARLRITEDGSTPTSASAQVGSALMEATASSVPRNSAVCLADYYPASDLQLSVFLGWILVGGSGTATLSASANTPVALFIVSLGLDPGNTGVVL